MNPRGGVIFVLVALSVAIAWFLSVHDGPVGKQSHAQCMTNADCITGEVCTVFPKHDGFVTFGVCGEPCATADTCPNGWKCLPFTEGTDHTDWQAVPPTANSVTARLYCVAGARK